MFQRIGSIFDEYKDIPREANLLIYSSFFTWAAAGLFFISLYKSSPTGRHLLWDE